MRLLEATDCLGLQGKSFERLGHVIYRIPISEMGSDSFGDYGMILGMQLAHRGVCYDFQIGIQLLDFWRINYTFQSIE